MATATHKGKKLVTSFVYLGCNRLEPEQIALYPSTANLAQLDSTLADIAALPIKPDYLFFVGDLVLGLNRDTSVLSKELQAWVAHYEASPVAKAGIKLVVTTGNHEMLYLVKTKKSKQELSNPNAEQVFTRILSKYIVGNNGPHAGGPDSLATDQSQLTYSFNNKGVHYVLMNTDPFGQPNSVPVNWLTQDITMAHADSTIKQIFVLGHRPLYVPKGNEEQDGLLSQDSVRQAQFRNTLLNNNCVALLTAHAHLYDRSQIAPGKTWQVITGNGGSKLAKHLGKEGKSFGFTQVLIYDDGTVQLKHIARDEPKESYYAPSAGYLATLRDSAELVHK